MTELMLIRGLPGSGKTSFARSTFYFHVEADMFFMRKKEYKFEPKFIKHAHKWCQDTTRDALSNGVSTVVSNTFIRLWEMQPYIDMAEKIGCELFVYRMITNFGNTHNVPDDVVKRMSSTIQDFEDEIIIDDFSL